MAQFPALAHDTDSALALNLFSAAVPGTSRADDHFPDFSSATNAWLPEAPSAHDPAAAQ